MVTSLRGVPLVLLLALIACSAGPNPPAAPAAPHASATAPAEAWGCYDLKPGHPTASEQEAFVDEVARLATSAEDRYGVPAAALVAMAIAESGYGWTRLALNTDNLFAWKHFPGSAAEGRQYWVLECQPDEPGTRFVVFADRAEAVDFVARQLATSDNYRADTERYRRDRAAEAVQEPSSASAWTRPQRGVVPMSSRRLIAGSKASPIRTVRIPHSGAGTCARL
jgi:hypothetical protein